MSSDRPTLLRFTIALVFSFVCLAVPVWADFKAGIDAYDRGDYATALRELRPMAEGGNAAAQFMLAFLYANGKSVPQDLVQARQWYEKAAAQGISAAQLNLGALYATGNGVPQDLVQAWQWYQKAAAQGSADAATNLGTMYMAGSGVAQDYQMALFWFRQAADQGNTSARLKLGAMYERGNGVPQDCVQAHMWYNLGAVTGEEMAAGARDLLAKQMTPVQITEAEKLAREWKPKGP